VNRKPQFVIAAVAAVLAVAYVVNPYSRLAVHFLVSQVSHGVSAGKIFFFLAFVGVFSLRAAMLRHPVERRRGELRWFWAFVVVGLAASFGSHLLYVSRYGLPMDWYTLHWLNGVNSVNSTTHIHTSKAIIAHVLNAVGLERLNESFDTGAAYMQAAPAWLSWLIGIPFLASLGLGIWVGPRIVERYEPRARAAIYLAAAIAFSSVCKCILDGGALAYDAVAGAMCIAAFSGASGVNELGGWLRRRVGRMLCAVLGWLLVIAILDVSTLGHQIECFAYRSAIYALLLGLGWRSACKPRLRWRPAIAWGLGAATAGTFAINEAGTWVVPLLKTAPTSVLRYDRAAGTSESVPVCTAVAVPPNTSYFAAYLQIGELPTRVRRASVSGDRPNRPTGVYADVIVLATRQEQLLFKASPLVKIVRLEEDSTSSLRRFHVQVEFSAECGPVLWRGDSAGHDQIDENEKFAGYMLLDDYLRAAGIGEYILIPYAQYVAPAERTASNETIKDSCRSR